MSILSGCTFGRKAPPATEQAGRPQEPATPIRLPEPQREGKTSVEEALLKRRSVRDYRDEPLTLAQVAQLLWAAQGITSPDGFRTAPSAGALYPLEIYVVAGNVEGMAAGVYRYRPGEHSLAPVAAGDRRRDLAAVALEQTWIREAAVDLVFAGVYERTTQKYGERGVRYVYMEVGHAAQNVYLQAVSLSLGAVVVGAFEDDKVQTVVGMAADEHPLYIMAIGKGKGTRG
jgi:SagB-type dehydrogenase family enzyme